MNEIDRLLGQMGVGQTAQLALQLVEEKLKASQYATDMIAYQQVTAGTLTPEKALSFWYKKHALYELHTRLLQEVRAGQTSATKAASILEADQYE